MGIHVSWALGDEVTESDKKAIVRAIQEEIRCSELNEEDCLAFVHPASQPSYNFGEKFTWIAEGFMPRCETWVVTRESLREGFFRVFG